MTHPNPAKAKVTQENLDAQPGEEPAIVPLLRRAVERDQVGWAAHLSFVDANALLAHLDSLKRQAAGTSEHRVIDALDNLLRDRTIERDSLRTDLDSAKRKLAEAETRVATAIQTASAAILLAESGLTDGQLHAARLEALAAIARTGETMTEPGLDVVREQLAAAVDAHRVTVRACAEWRNKYEAAESALSSARAALRDRTEEAGRFTALLARLVAKRFAPADDADGHGLTYRLHAAEWQAIELLQPAKGEQGETKFSEAARAAWDSNDPFTPEDEVRIDRTRERVMANVGGERLPDVPPGHKVHCTCFRCQQAREERARVSLQEEKPPEPAKGERCGKCFGRGYVDDLDACGCCTTERRCRECHGTGRLPSATTRPPRKDSTGSAGSVDAAHRETAGTTPSGDARLHSTQPAETGRPDPVPTPNVKTMAELHTAIAWLRENGYEPDPDFGSSPQGKLLISGREWVITNAWYIGAIAPPGRRQEYSIHIEPDLRDALKKSATVPMVEPGRPDLNRIPPAPPVLPDLQEARAALRRFLAMVRGPEANELHDAICCVVAYLEERDLLDPPEPSKHRPDRPTPPKDPKRPED